MFLIRCHVAPCPQRKARKIWDPFPVKDSNLPFLVFESKGGHKKKHKLRNSGLFIRNRIKQLRSLLFLPGKSQNAGFRYVPEKGTQISRSLLPHVTPCPQRKTHEICDLFPKKEPTSHVFGFLVWPACPESWESFSGKKQPNFLASVAYRLSGVSKEPKAIPSNLFEAIKSSQLA